MNVYTANIKMRTEGFCDFHDITHAVAAELSSSGMQTGIACVFVSGSTAGLTTIEYESGALDDLKEAIERLAPQAIPYRHDARWGDGNGFSHVRAALLGPSLTVPFSEGKLNLGTWQQIVLIDFDNRARNRNLMIRMLGK